MIRTTFPMTLSDKEKKLLILAFDSAAGVGEAMAAIRALIKMWLLKYPDGYALIKDLEASEKVVVRERVIYRNESPYGNFVLTFGVYKSQRLRDIEISYLLWCLENFVDLYPATRRAIEGYLEGKL
jgi:hypothetical protein